MLISDAGDCKEERAAARASVERYRQLVDATADLIYGFDTALTVTGINRAAAQSLGLQPAEAVGRPLADLGVPAATLDLWTRMTQAVRSSRQVVREVVELAMPDGQTHAYEAVLGPILDDEGHLLGFRGVSRDVSALKRAESELRKSEERFRGIFEQGSVGIALLDPDQSFVHANAAFCHMLGYTEDELLKLKIADITAPEDVQSSVEASRGLYTGERSVLAMEKRYRRKDGGVIWGDLSVSLVHGNDGTAIGSVAVVQDITSRKQAEESLRESEDRYQTLVNLSPDAMIVNVGGKYAFANPAAARLFGMNSPSELLGGDLITRIHPDDREMVAARMALVLEGVLTSPAEIRVLRLDGSAVEVEATAARVEFDGSPAGQVIFRDVSERRRSEELLRLTQFSVDRVADSVFWTDSDARLIYVSDSTCRLHGYSRDEMLGLTLFDLDRSLSAEQWSANWQRMKQDGPFTFETINWTKEGRAIPVEVSVNYLEFNGREYNCAFARDTTDRILAEEERLEFERRLQQSQRLESLGVLAGGIAHDFNNILMSVLGNAELALTTLPAASAVRGNLLEITASSRRAADLCRQMLAYSGRGQLVAEAIDVGELIGDMLGFLRSTVSKKALLDINLGENLPLMRGDASQISQVIMNLVLNASEALGESGGVITISTAVKQCWAKDLEGLHGDESLAPGSYLTLEISDTGSGMDAATQDRIFEPFFTTRFSGRGLGLSAVLGIVRGHKGGLRLSSELGKGTTFEILFPVSEVATESTVRTGGSTKDRWRGEGTVLLVDDEEAIRTLGGAMLDLLGFTVLTAADGREALAVYAEHRDEIALVLLDLTMPHMDGEETFQELRALDPEVRVILSSGYARADVIARFAGRGLVGFVHKPYSLAELTEQLRVALEEANI